MKQSDAIIIIVLTSLVWIGLWHSCRRVPDPVVLPDSPEKAAIDSITRILHRMDTVYVNHIRPSVDTAWEAYKRDKTLANCDTLIRLQAISIDHLETRTGECDTLTSLLLKDNTRLRVESKKHLDKSIKLEFRRNSWRLVAIIQAIILGLLVLL